MTIPPEETQSHTSSIFPVESAQSASERLDDPRCYKEYPVKGKHLPWARKLRH